jgi:hypothetical protein
MPQLPSFFFSLLTIPNSFLASYCFFPETVVFLNLSLLLITERNESQANALQPELLIAQNGASGAEPIPFISEPIMDATKQADPAPVLSGH